MKEFTLPKPLKHSYWLALVLMIVGMVSKNDVAAGVAVVVISVLVVGHYILEAIHELKATK